MRYNPKMRFSLCFFVLLLIAGCDGRTYQPGRKINYAIQFNDQAQTNVSPSPDALRLEFRDLAGKLMRLSDYRGKQNVVLVFTRGFSGSVCAYCSALTSRLIAQHGEFVKRDAQVLVVFPGPKEHVQDFLDASARQAREKSGASEKSAPFPILLDEDFKAVDQLDLRADLAKPSTFIFNKQGELVFAYVGSNLSDRPSIKAMLAQLDAIAAE